MKFSSKALTISISIVIAVMVPVASADAAVKTGAACAKAGLTSQVNGFKFTCMKSGKKFVWGKGVAIQLKTTPSPTPSASSSVEPSETPVSPSATPSSTPSLVKYKNCTDVKAAGAAPLTKAKSPELYELNAGLDRDKDGVACES